jgi:enoyl-CoA hydratase
MGEFVKVETKEGTSVVTVSREKALNALNPDVLKELRKTFQELSGNPEVRSIIITGSGDKAFIAGADIVAMSKMSVPEAAEFTEIGHATMNTISSCRKPVIAAVNGFCFGGGLELALSCDFIYASEKAKIGLPEVGLGLYPGFGGTQRLSRAIGSARAKELIFSARTLTAQGALEWGIVNKVCSPETLIEEAGKCAAEINSKGPVSVALAKKVINEGKDESLAVGLEIEKGSFALCFSTEDLKEGLTAFLEKRKPEFKGK